jgi:hypothetical protein
MVYSPPPVVSFYFDLTPLIPLSWIGEGEIEEEGRRPSFTYTPPFL